MINGLLFKKIEMSQTFDREGRLVPVTVLEAPENVVVQIKTLEKDGYQAVQLGAGKKKRSSKPQMGHFKRAGLKTNFSYLREFKISDDRKISLGQKLKIEEVFGLGDLVLARGVSKGRGFSGVVKRWGFATQPKTRGQSDRERAPGSIGAQTPGRVLKGKKMPGHFGSSRVTIKNLLILKIEPKTQRVWLKGAIPGHNNSWIVVDKTGRRAKDIIHLGGEDKDEQEIRS